MGDGRFKISRVTCPGDRVEWLRRVREIIDVKNGLRVRKPQRSKLVIKTSIWRSEIRDPGASQDDDSGGFSSLDPVDD